MSVTDCSVEELRQLVKQIGNTPLVALSLTINGDSRRIYVKLEGCNPGGSSKDRTAYSLIKNIEISRSLTRSSIILESTSGNLGVALSFICRAKGYPFVAVVDPKITQENLRKMQSLGARIEMVEEPDSTGGYLGSRIRRVRDLCGQSDDYIWLDQYSNPANPLVHYKKTSPEIHRQMGGKVNAVFLAVSTGGTLAGVARYFREVSPGTRIIGVDALGSVIFGGVPGRRHLTGIGSSRASSFIEQSHYDGHFLVSDVQAFLYCRQLFSKTGIKVGGSSGAVLAACAKYLEADPRIENVVCVCPDRGENYDSTIFNDLWLSKIGIDLSNSQCSIQGISSVSATGCLAETVGLTNAT